MRKAVVLMLAGLAVACGPRAHPVLVMDGETPEARRMNAAACRFEAARATAGIVHPNAFIQAAERDNSEARVFRLCMLARGYREEPRTLTFAQFMAIRNEGK